MKVDVTIITDNGNFEKIMLDFIRRFKAEPMPVRMLFYNLPGDMPVVYDNARWIQATKELKEAEDEITVGKTFQVQAT